MSFSILGTGSALGSVVQTNDDLSRHLDTSDWWIKSKTGIEERRFLGEETLMDLAEKAAVEALKMSKVTADELDLIICATISSEYKSPSLACIMQKRLNANCPAFDISAGCSGFIYALDVADTYFFRNNDMKILVIGAEAVSRIMDKNDRSTAVLFGDGAGACVLGKGEGLRAITTSAKGNIDYLFVPDKDGEFLQMQGQKVFQFAVSTMMRNIKKVLKIAGLENNDVDYYLPHQANMRIIDFAIEKLNVKREKFLTNIQKTGNTSAASIHILLDENVRNGKIKKGDTLVMSAFGAGLTSASLVINWEI